MTGSTDTGTLHRQLTFVALGALGVVGLARRAGARLRPVRPLAPIVLAYVAVMAASVLWADVPALALRRFAAFALLFAAIAGAVRQLDGDDVVDLTFLATSGYLAVGLVVEVANGLFRPLSGGYRFFGLFHPNATGQACALLVLAALALPRDRAPRWLRVAAVVAGLALLYLTKSRAAAAAAVAALGARWLVTTRPSRALFGVVLAAWLACLGLLLAGEDAGGGAERAVLMGRAAGDDARTLSGRTALWAELWRDVAARPLAGHGYGSYWTADHVERISMSQGWAVSHGHSVYVDQLLELGALGLALFVPMLAIATARALRRFRATGDDAHGFAFTLLVFTAVVGLLESVVASPALPSALFYWSVAFLAFREPTPLPASAR
jgi:O-antigen ligase